MSDTTFVSKTTVIPTAWCQDVNNTIYRILGTGVGGTAPQSAADVRTNLGISTSGTSVLKGNGTGWISNSKVALTEPATGCTITVADGKTLTCSNNITLAGTDGSTTGTSAFLNVGTAAHNVVQLDASAKLPAIDGSQLTNLPGVTGSAIVQDFRLSLQTAVPVPTSDITAGTTLYCTPYRGNKISLYTGGSWVTRSTAEFSISVAGLLTDIVYDIFCYDNAGTPTLEIGPAWTNTTTRSTALMRQDGVYVKNADATRRYIGTVYCNTAGGLNDKLVERSVWNYYNRIPRSVYAFDATASWAYSTATVREANGSSGGNIFQFTTGVAEDAIMVNVNSAVSTSTSTNHAVYTGVGLDVTTAFYRNIFTRLSITNTMATQTFGISGAIDPQIGSHYVAWLEEGGGGDVQTWLGGVNSGINGIVMC